MDSNIPSCHDEAGLNSDSDNDISPLLIFAIKKRSSFSIFSSNDLPSLQPDHCQVLIWTEASEFWVSSLLRASHLLARTRPRLRHRAVTGQAPVRCQQCSHLPHWPHDDCPNTGIITRLSKHPHTFVMTQPEQYWCYTCYTCPDNQHHSGAQIFFRVIFIL